MVKISYRITFLIVTGIALSALLQNKAQAQILRWPSSESGTKEKLDEPSSQTNSQNRRNQLEELFLWKISEELKLSTSEEKQFTEKFRSLSATKQKLNQQIDSAMQEFIHATTDTNRKTAFNQYKKSLQLMNRFNVDEVETLSQILGLKKFAKYIEIRFELTNKVKSLMLNSEKNLNEKKKLPPPQVIEQGN